MTKQKWRVVVEFGRVLDLRSGLFPQCKDSSLPGCVFRFVPQESGEINRRFLPRIHAKYPDLFATRIGRFNGPLQVRKLCTSRNVDQNPQSTFGTSQSGGVIGEQSFALKSSQNFLGYDPLTGQGLQRVESHGKLGWPWISVVPSETGGQMGRVKKQRAVRTEQIVPTPKDTGPLVSSESMFPFLSGDLEVGNLLSILHVNVTDKICYLLSSYGWSAHTLLELRTFIAQGMNLRPQVVLDVLSRQRQADLAFNFLHWTVTETSCRPHIKCFTVVMRLIGRVRNYALLEKLLIDLDKGGYLPDKIIFTAAMGCYAGGQKMQEALEIFVKMKERGFKPDCVTYSVLIHMLSKAKLYQDALRLFEELIAQGVATDTQLYNCVVSTFAKAGRLDIAYQKLEEMRERGHIPDEFTYAVLLEGYAKAGRTQLMDLYYEMQNAGIPQNEVIFNIMFLGIERIGTIHDAEILFADMERLGLSLNLRAFSTLIGMFSRKGDPAGAQRWFDKTVSLGLQPTVAMGNSLLDSYAKAKRFAEASQVLGSFQSWRIIPNLPTLTVCLRCFSLCESLEDMEVVKKMLSCHRSSQFLSALQDRSAEKNTLPVVASLFNSLCQEGRHNRQEFINVVISYLYQSGFRTQAYRVLEGALANFMFPALVEQGQDGICSVNLKDMACGTATVAITHILPRLAKQFHRKEMTPIWVQIYTAHVTDEIPPQDPASVHHAIEMLLVSLRSPFRVGTVETGGGFVCGGEEVMHWLDEPEIKALFTLRHQ